MMMYKRKGDAAAGAEILVIVLVREVEETITISHLASHCDIVM